MSGIVGILNLDGAPVDRSLLDRMTRFMSFRGPDGQHSWLNGNVGFGHTLLQPTDEPTHERQPCSLDGHVWITAEARADGQRDLVRELEAAGKTDLSGATDAELLLHAYQTWAELCVEHLIGDFAFAIWDGRRHRLFCARDHFGVKPFYYIRAGITFVFSNTLNCLRSHPLSSDDLNEMAVADFLLFLQNQELDTTTFAKIGRLPPAHTLTFSRGGATVRRY